MAQSVISHGPWTLHESADRFDHDESGDHFRHEGSDERPEHEDHNDFFKHDASGIVPTTAGPPYSGSGGPYAGYCSPTGNPPDKHGLLVIEPHYFPFLRRLGHFLEGFFYYLPRQQPEAGVAPVSGACGPS